jgi:eukaryotic-like serine/threonine-protein kinase
MDPKRWEKLEALVDQALAMPPEQREEFLGKTCGGDTELRREAESLLSHSDQALKFMSDFSDKVITPSLSEVKAQHDQPGPVEKSALLNKTIAHYYITEKLGEGGMGVVYKARDMKLDRTVALKFLPEHLIASEKDKQRFIREAKAAAALNHPNICTIHNVDEHDGNPFIVMEYIDGSTLRDLRKSENPEPSVVMDFAAQIADALHKAHGAGIIHRDIKPGNVMVNADGRIKVMDFGIAKLKSSGQITKTGRIMGTIAYMSPEQIRGEPVDHRSDIWALGVVLYEMLAGEHPFAGKNNAAVLHSILNKEPLPVGELLPDCPRVVQNIVWKLLQKNPSERYQNAGEVVDDLQLANKDVQEIVWKLLQKNASERYQHAGEMNDDLQQTNKELSSEEHAKLSKPTKGGFVSIKRKSLVYGIPIFLLLFVGIYFLTGDRILAPEIGNSIAVLPLENLSPDPEDAFFADGIHEEIISSLSGIGSLRVIARSSVRDYSPGGRNLAQIGRELGVSTLMEGAVRRAGDRIRVSMNLIDAEDQSMIWSDTYEDHVQDVFGLQSRIAREITDALQATLTASEQQRLEEQPTENPQAYLFYMQGRDYLGRSRHLEENPLAAEQLFRRALQEDTRFAHAYAQLAVAYSDLYWFYGQSPERLEQMREAAERAELLAPDLAETQLALGLYHYWSETDHERTLYHFESALQQFPNHPVLHHFTALTHRRLGNWDQAEYHYERAVKLDPRNINHYMELAWFYYIVREYDKARNVSERALEMSPDAPAGARNINAYIVLETDGTLDGYENWREEISPSDPAEVAPVQWGYFYYYWKRDWENALRSFNNISSEVVWELDTLILLRDYLIATVYDHKGDRTTALEHFDQARMHLETLREKQPEIPRNRAMLGRIYARIGQPEKAIQEGKIATEMMPLHKNALEGASYNTDLAYIYAWSGYHEEAIDKLELLLSIPAPDIHINRLRLNPDWDPLRDHPRFQALIAEEDEPN